MPTTNLEEVTAKLKNLTLLLIVFALLNPMISFSESIEPISSNSVPTRFGVITTGFFNETTYGTLGVNDREILRSKVGAFLLYAVYHLGEIDAVLFGEQCACSDQTAPHLNFILLASGKRPSILTEKDFISSDGTLEPKRIQDGVLINLGYENGKQKLAELKSGQLTVRLVQTATQLDRKNCKMLYEKSSDNCTKTKSIGLECKYANPSDGSSAGMTEIRIASQRPGFNSSAMDNVCRSECETAKPVTYEQFKKEVCSIK